MTTTTKTTPAPTLAEATDAVEAANALRADLREKVANGDDTVTPADIAAADGEVVLAELRFERVLRRVAAEDEKNRAADVAGWQAKVDSYDQSLVPLAKLQASAERTLLALNEAALEFIAEREVLLAGARSRGIFVGHLPDFDSRWQGKPINWMEMAALAAQGKLPAMFRHPLRPVAAL